LSLSLLAQVTSTNPFRRMVLAPASASGRGVNGPFVAAIAAISILAHVAQQGARGHGDPALFPVNPVLGVSGFPDCYRIHPWRQLDMVEASFDLACPQR
jgi:hypothetical protein